MYLQTKIPVKWVVQGKFYEIKETIVIGELFLESTNIITMEKTFQYRYSSAEGEIIMTGSKTYSSADINALYLQVKDLIPTGLDYTETEKYLYYYGFIYEFAGTVSLPVSDIDLIV